MERISLVCLSKLVFDCDLFVKKILFRFYHFVFSELETIRNSFGLIAQHVSIIYFVISCTKIIYFNEVKRSEKLMILILRSLSFLLLVATALISFARQNCIAVYFVPPAMIRSMECQTNSICCCIYFCPFI